MEHDLLVKNARVASEEGLVDLACANGKVAAVGPGLEASAKESIDAEGNFLSPPFVDCHFHMDSTMSCGRPRLNESGTLAEGIRIWGDLKRQQSREEIVERALGLCNWSLAKGVLAIRSHVDVTDPTFNTVEALLEVRERMKGLIDIQLVAFPQDGYFRDENAVAQVERSLDMGVDVVGGIPHHERTTQDGAESVAALCRVAAERGLRVDMHCDESDDPNSRHIETLAKEAVRHGLQGRVTGSHLTSMHSMDNYYAAKLLVLMAQSQVTAVSNPLINITLQGRQDTYPKRRGLARIKEMWEQGITVAFGHDCVMDPWYPFGTHDMLDVAHMAVHAGQLTTPDQISRSFGAVTTDAAAVFGLEGYGTSVGDNADFVILQASSPFEAVRLRANRLYVVRRGRVIARSKRQFSEVTVGGKTVTVDFTRPPGTA